jgi:RNA recognition motif-containing protein
MMLLVKMLFQKKKSPRGNGRPPEVESKSSIHDHAAAVSMVASIINAQLSGLQTSVLASQVQQPVTPKESRELFVGNVLASGVSDAILKDFLNAAMKQVGLITGPEDPIVTCRMNAKFSFIELRTPEDAKNALNLNGIPFMGQCLKISRPSKYVGPAYQPKTWQEITGQAPVSSTQVFT